MNVLRLACLVWVGSVLLAACGSPSTTGLQTPQSRKVAKIARDGTMKQTTSNDLLYITGGSTNKVFVFSYPDGEPVQTLTGLEGPNGICVDTSGDVYVTQSTGDIAEYKHGGSSPINTITGANATNGCAVDPTTGSLAATTGSSVSVWQNGQGTPTIYDNYNVYEITARTTIVATCSSVGETSGPKT